MSVVQYGLSPGHKTQVLFGEGCMAVFLKKYFYTDRKLDQPSHLFDGRAAQHVVEIWEVCTLAPLPASETYSYP